MPLRTFGFLAPQPGGILDAACLGAEGRSGKSLALGTDWGWTGCKDRKILNTDSYKNQ